MACVLFARARRRTLHARPLIGYPHARLHVSIVPRLYLIARYINCPDRRAASVSSDPPPLAPVSARAPRSPWRSCSAPRSCLGTQRFTPIVDMKTERCPPPALSMHAFASFSACLAHLEPGSSTCAQTLIFVQSQPSWSATMRAGSGV